ncbi:MAG: glycosyltransferase [Desulfovibrio sp.]
MRILNLHHTAFVQVFRALGHEVLSLGTTAECDVALGEALSRNRLGELLAARFPDPDCVFWFDSCEVPWVFGLETLPTLTIGYSVDQYMHPWHVPYSAAFDAFFVAQKDFLPLFADCPTGRPAFWSPLFCNPRRDTAGEQARDIPVSFVGTLDGRVNTTRRAFLDAFRQRAPLFATTGSYVPVFQRSRIVLNQSVAGELNFRIFEAMACGAAVLTEETGNGLHDLFIPGENILTYKRGDPADAARVAQVALDDPNLGALAAAGRRTVLAHHTITQRAKTILDTAKSLIASRAPARRLAQLSTTTTETRKAYAMLAVDEHLPLPDAQRLFFLKMADGSGGKPF